MDLKEVLGEAYKDGMTFDEVAEALKAHDLVDRAEATKGMVSKVDFDKTKSAFNKASSDLAAAKRQLKEKLSADEQSEIERRAADEAVQAELEGLRQYKAVNEHTVRFLKLGYSEKLAQETAEAMVAQDFDKVFANQQAFLAERDKALQKQLTLANDKRPPAGDSTDRKNFTRMAAEAGEQGNKIAQAYYTRLAQQNDE